MEEQSGSQERKAVRPLWHEPFSVLEGDAWPMWDQMPKRIGKNERAQAEYLGLLFHKAPSEPRCWPESLSCFGPSFTHVSPRLFLLIFTLTLKLSPVASFPAWGSVMK